MSVASHLNIELAEYDERIRTFVPHYERMIATVADALTLLDTRAPTIVDLGTGTGALAAKCLDALPDARLIGIDMDPGMLEVARSRLRGARDVQLEAGSFLGRSLPACDAFVACISLHHIRDAEEKKAFYATCRDSLRPGGLLISADCYMAGDAPLKVRQREAWLAHLQRTYSRAEAEGYLAAWAGEDTYFPLADEVGWMKAAGLAPEVLWSENGFAVVAARREG